MLDVHNNSELLTSMGISLVPNTLSQDCWLGGGYLQNNIFAKK